MTRAVVDASVAVKWLVRQDGSDKAYAAFERYELTAPSLILAEIGNALWKYHRAGIVSAEKIRESMIGIETAYFVALPIDEALSIDALNIAANIAHPIHDCYYLAAAARIRAPLITADERLSRKARAAAFNVVDLATLPDVSP